MGDYIISRPDGSNTNNNNINNNVKNNIKVSSVDRDGIKNMTSYLHFITDNEQKATSHEAGHSAVTEVVPEQQEVNKAVRDLSVDEHSDNGRESDADAYSFTEDQKRAMMELMIQNEDEDLLDEEPPEYNVKERLIQLNEELASDPTPATAEREHKVIFLPTVVDLVVSPPPDYSDEEHQSINSNQKSEGSETASSTHEENNTGSSGAGDVSDLQENFDNPSRRQFVIERDGRFSVVTAKDLTAEEYEMLIDEEDNKKKDDKHNGNEKAEDKDNSHDTSSAVTLMPSRIPSGVMAPQPPSRSRPKSVATSSRKSSHHAFSPKRRSASMLNSSSTNINDFAYISPYAMKPEEKAAARERARRMEIERKEMERQKKQEEQEKQKLNEDMFQAWLSIKREQDKQRQNTQTKMGNSDKEDREKNEEAYKEWVKEKNAQVKQERLLKRRQQEEHHDGFIMRSREECEKAFRDWLKKKNAEVRKQQLMERQRNKLYRIQVKYSRKTVAFIRALKEAHAFGYLDLYGYRF